MLKAPDILAELENIFEGLNGSQLAKNEKVYSCHVTAMKLMGEAVDLKNYNYTLKITIFVNM